MKSNKITNITLATLAGLSLVGCGKTITTPEEVGEITTSVSESSSTATTSVEKAKTAEKIVEQYAEAVFAGDYEKALAMIQMPEGSVKDVTAFEYYLLKSDLEPVEVKKVQTEELGSGEERAVKVIVTTKSGEIIETTFYAQLTDDNKWAISPKDMVTENWKIVVPAGSTVSLNGQSLTTKPQTEHINVGEVNEMVHEVYTIPMIISANYHLKVEHPFTETLEESKIYPGATKQVDLALSPDVLAQAESAMNQLLKTINSFAAEGKDFGELVDVVVSPNSKALTSMQEAYNELSEKLTKTTQKGNYYQYRDLTASNISIERATYLGDQTVYVSGTYESIYKQRYSYKETGLEERAWELKTDSLKFEAAFEVTKEGDYLLLQSGYIFGQLR